MGAAENKELVRRWYEEGFFGDLSIADEVFAPEFVRVFSELKRSENRVTLKEYKDGVQRTQDALTDGRCTVEHIVAEGDSVAVAVTISGTHTGQFGDETPTNKKGQVTMHMFLRFADGKVVEKSHASGQGRYIEALRDGTLHKEQEAS